MLHLDKKQDIDFCLKFFANCPFPLKNHKKENSNLYISQIEKNVGNYDLLITGDQKIGIASGTDNLIVLYLTQMALKHNSNKFKVTLNNFFDYFNMANHKNNYFNYGTAFKRVYFSTFHLTNNLNSTDGSFAFKIIQAWKDNFGDDKELKSKEICLDPIFFDLISRKNYTMPYQKSVLQKTKKSPFLTNLYIFLVYRCHTNFLKEQKEIKIPFWGKKGLKEQLSVGTKLQKSFRQKIKGAIEELQKIWIDAPFSLKEEIKMTKKGPKESIIDGLFIYVKNKSQLNVAPGLFAEQKSKELKKIHFKFCPQCGEKIEKRYGKKVEDGRILDDFLYCSNCNKNFYKHNSPELFEKKLVEKRNKTNVEVVQKIPQYIFDFLKQLDAAKLDINFSEDGAREKFIKISKEIEKLKKEYQIKD